MSKQMRILLLFTIIALTATGFKPAKAQSIDQLGQLMAQQAGKTHYKLV